MVRSLVHGSDPDSDQTQRQFQSEGILPLGQSPSPTKPVLFPLPPSYVSRKVFISEHRVLKWGRSGWPVFNSRLDIHRSQLAPNPDETTPHIWTLVHAVDRFLFPSSNSLLLSGRFSPRGRGRSVLVLRKSCDFALHRLRGGAWGATSQSLRQRRNPTSSSAISILSEGLLAMFQIVLRLLGSAQLLYLWLTNRIIAGIVTTAMLSRLPHCSSHFLLQPSSSSVTSLCGSTLGEIRFASLPRTRGLTLGVFYRYQLFVMTRKRCWHAQAPGRWGTLPNGIDDSMAPT